MKKLLVAVLAIVLAFTLLGCGSSVPPAESTPDSTTGQNVTDDPGVRRSIEDWKIAESINLWEALSPAEFSDNTGVAFNRRLDGISCETNNCGQLFFLTSKRKNNPAETTRYPVSEFTLWLKTDSGFFKLASVDFSYFIDQIGHSPEPSPASLLFDKNNNPCMIGFREGDIVAYKYNMASGEITEYTVAKLMDAEKDKHPYQITFVPSADKASVYFSVVYSQVSADNGGYIRFPGDIGYFDTEKLTKCIITISESEYSSIRLAYSKYDNALYICLDKWQGSKNAKHFSLDIYKVTGVEKGNAVIEQVSNLIEKNLPPYTSEYLYMSDYQGCTCGFITDEAGKLYVAYAYTTYNDKFPGIISAIQADGSASSVPLKPTVDYVNDPYLGNYFIKDGQLYCIELYKDRTQFSILKVDAETGNTEIVKQIKLPAEINENKYLLKASYRNDGLDVLYLANAENVYYYLRVE